MKKTILIILIQVFWLTGFSQSKTNNVEIGLFKNGTHGSNMSFDAGIEIAIKPVISAYSKVPVSEELVMYLAAPKTEFDMSDAVRIVQTNPALFGTNGTMLVQAVFDLGGPDLYFPIVLNSHAGIELTSLPMNEWSFVFTISFTRTKSEEALRSVKIIDRTNNAELTAANNGNPLFTHLDIGMVNQLTERYTDGLKTLANPVDDAVKPTAMSISGIYPNPATTLINVIVEAPARQDVTLVVMDALGKSVKQKLVNVETGSNTVPVELSGLAQGNYLVKVLSRSGETTVSKFVKQQ